MVQQIDEAAEPCQHSRLAILHFLLIQWELGNFGCGSRILARTHKHSEYNIEKSVHETHCEKVCSKDDEVLQ